MIDDDPFHSTGAWLNSRQIDLFGGIGGGLLGVAGALVAPMTECRLPFTASTP